MTEALGRAWLPAVVPTRNADRSIATRAPGDPALPLLGSYIATVMQAQLNDAWTTLDSRADISLPSMVDDTRAGVGVVRRVYYHNPRKGVFVGADLPGLFVYRYDNPVKMTRPAQDAHRRNGQIGLLWIPGEGPSKDIERNEWDTFRNSVSASMHNALTYKRHPAWTAPDDDAIPAGLKTTASTSTSAIIITSFNGSNLTVNPKRSASITTSATTGAFNTNEPIIWTGEDEVGSFTERTYLTNANGGETIPTVMRFKKITRVELPAMLLATGSYTLGWWDSYEKAQGSLIQRVCGFITMSLRDIRDVSFDITREGPDKELGPLKVTGVEAVLDVGEDQFWDPDFRARTPYVVEAHVRRPDGEDFTALETT